MPARRILTIFGTMQQRKTTRTGIIRFARIRRIMSNFEALSLKIWQDGQLVRNFRPVLLESGLAALWDSVSKQVFLPSAPFSAMGPVSGEFEIKSGTTILIR